MRILLELVGEPIDEAALVRTRAASPGAGAAVCFTGIVRGSERGRAIQALEYEAHESMARHQFQKLLEEAGRRWPLESVRVKHRVGVVPVGEAAIWVEVLAAHRAEAFAACQWILDEMKRVVPIWKKTI